MLTTLPVLCLGLACAPERRSLLAAARGRTVGVLVGGSRWSRPGLALRGLGQASEALFARHRSVAAFGIGLANTCCCPAVVKRDFPGRAGADDRASTP